MKKISDTRYKHKIHNKYPFNKMILDLKNKQKNVTQPNIGFGQRLIFFLIIKFF